MNSSFSPSKEYEIDLLDYIWKLLMQWKAILIVCIALAILVPGAKYLKDSKAYDASLIKQEEASKEAALPIEERISDILENLPESDASTVQFILKEQDLIDLLKNYLNNSIWLNTDPASQRNIILKYYINKSEDASDMQTIIDAYDACICRSDELDPLREIISPDASPEFIRELIQTKPGIISDSNAASSIYTVTVTLPEDADADKVISAVDSNIDSINDTLVSTLGRHSVKRISAEDCHLCNLTVSDKRASVTNIINNLNNNITNTKANLNESQLKALNAINVARASAATAENSAATSKDSARKPSFSKKFALFGFVLGAVIYAGLYLLLIMFRKNVSSAASAQSCTGKRLLGEIYSFEEHKGIEKLLTSRFVAEKRFKAKLDPEAQTENAAATIDAVCSHHDTNSLALLMSGDPEQFKDTLNVLTKKCGNNDRKISFDMIDAVDPDEKALSCVSNAVYLLNSKSKTGDVRKLGYLCDDYGVNILGTVYMENL